MALILFVTRQKDALYQITENRFNQLHFRVGHITDFAVKTYNQIIGFTIMGHSWATTFRAWCIPVLSVPSLQPYFAV
jgi:hypothetical protein